MKYEVKLKRKGIGPPIVVTVENGKLSIDSAMTMFKPSSTCMTITKIINTMEDEGLEWIRVDEK